MAQELDGGQRHILRLIARDANKEGWCPVSSQLFPVLKKSMPIELVEIEPDGDEGRGRARLTAEGKSVINAMAWL